MSQKRFKIAASSFCVYLFGLEPLAATGRGASFFAPTYRDFATFPPLAGDVFRRAYSPKIALKPQ